MATTTDSQATKVYYGDWEYENWYHLAGKEALERDFGIDPLPESVHVLFAYYSYENYSGDAYVLFEQDGKLYGVEGSHCSCYGLEDQWYPTEETKATLTAHNFSYRIENHTAYTRLQEIIAALPDEEKANASNNE